MSSLATIRAALAHPHPYIDVVSERDNGNAGKAIRSIGEGIDPGTFGCMVDVAYITVRQSLGGPVVQGFDAVKVSVAEAARELWAERHAK